MDPSRHERLVDIFTQAQSLTGPERERYLDRCCDDEGMRREVEELLAASDDDLDFLDDVAPRGLVDLGPPIAPELVGRRLGSYELVERLAEGGMGTVYRACQEFPRRDVAVKVVRHGVRSAAALRRFEFEAQLLAHLNHPGIAKVYDADVFHVGETAYPYIVMELIAEARSVTAFADQEGLGMRARIDLFLAVCDAVHHGHQRGVVHRDLKPDNLLVGSDGAVRVIDFGVALGTAQDLQRTVDAEVERIVGTFSYMSPEQVRGRPDDIDTRSDVYALGVVLYELLSGRAPIDLEGCSLPELSRRIAEDRPTPLGTIGPLLKGDLEAITRKALEKDKEQRYSSAAELAADLRRFLADEPILARPATAWYQARLFTRRNRGLVAGVMFGVMALLTGTVLAVRKADEATRAQHAERRRAYRNSITAAAAAIERHDVRLAQRSLQEAPEELRQWEWRHLDSRLDQSCRVLSLEGRADSKPWFVRVDGRTELRVATTHGVVAWPFERGVQLPDVVSAGASYACNSAGTHHVITHDGTMTVAAVDGADARIFDMTSWDAAGPGVTVNRLTLADDGGWLAWTDGERAYRLDVGAGAVESVRLESRGSSIDDLAMGPNGNVVFAAAKDGGPAVWSTDGRLDALPVGGEFARSVAWHAGRDRIVLGMQDTTLREYAASPGGWTPRGVGRGHEHAVLDVAFDPDGARLASVGIDRTVRLWEVETLAPLATLHGHARAVTHVSFSGDGAWLATTSEDGTVRLWDVSRAQEPGVIEHDALVFPVAFSRDGQWLGSATGDGWVYVRPPRAPARVTRFPSGICAVTALTFSRDGSRVVWYGDGGYGGRDLRSGAPLAVDAAAVDELDRVSVRMVAFADDVHVLLPWRMSADGVDVWNTDTGVVSTWPRRRLASITARIVSEDGRWYVGYQRRAREAGPRRASGDSGRLLAVRSVATGEPVLSDALSGAFAFRPTTWPATAGGAEQLAARRDDDPTRVAVFDLNRGVLVGELVGHTENVYGLDYSTDGMRIATAARDGLKLWDATTFEEIVQLSGHRSFVWSVAFHPDGTMLVSGSGDRTVRVWDTVATRLAGAAAR